MMKQTMLLLTILSFSTLSFAQLQNNHTVDLNEGVNTLELGIKTFEVTAVEGFVTKVVDAGEEYSRFNDQIATLNSRIDGFSSEIDIENSDAIYENDEYLVVIKLIPKEIGYNAQCYLFEK